MRLNSIDDIWGSFHDCFLLQVSVDYRQPLQSSCTFIIQICPDYGHPEWEGRVLAMTAVEVSFLSYKVHDAIYRDHVGEEINFVAAGVTDDVRAIASEFDRGVPASAPDCMPFVICLHSGATIDVVCRELHLKVRDAAPCQPAADAQKVNLRATLRMLATTEGGQSRPILRHPTRWVFGCILKKGRTGRRDLPGFSVFLILEKPTLDPGASYELGLAFLDPEYALQHVAAGDEFELWTNKVIGTGLLLPAT